MGDPKEIEKLNKKMTIAGVIAITGIAVAGVGKLTNNRNAAIAGATLALTGFLWFGILANEKSNMTTA